MGGGGGGSSSSSSSSIYIDRMDVGCVYLDMSRWACANVEMHTRKHLSFVTLQGVILGV